MKEELVLLSIRNIKHKYAGTYKNYLDSVIGKKLEEWRKNKALASKKIRKLSILRTSRA